jgi:hypothetical protein
VPALEWVSSPCSALQFRVVHQLLDSTPSHASASQATVGEHGKKLLFRPPAEDIAGTQAAADRLRHDPQYGIARMVAIDRSKLGKMVQLEQHHAERHVILLEPGKILPQMKLHVAVIGNLRGFVQRAVCRQVVLIAFVDRGDVVVFIETLRQPDDYAMHIAHRGDPHGHRNRMALFVA